MIAVNRPVFARLYPHMSKVMEQAGMAERRHTLLAGLTGEVFEIGGGGRRELERPPTSRTRGPQPMKVRAGQQLVDQVARPSRISQKRYSLSALMRLTD